MWSGSIQVRTWNTFLITMHACMHLQALLFGSMMAATDPVAVVAVLHEVKNRATGLTASLGNYLQWNLYMPLIWC